MRVGRFVLVTIALAALVISLADRLG